MERIRTILQRHAAAILLAAVTAIIVASPQVYFRVDHSELYDDGHEVIELFPDSPWSPRVREVMDGHPGLGNAYYKDGKDDPTIYQPLGTIVNGYTGKLLGLDINNTFLVSKTLYSFIAFICIYAFVFSIGRNKFAALASTTIVLLAESLLYPSGLKRFLAGALFGESVPINYLELSGPVLSSMIFVFLYLFLVAFWKFYETKSMRWGLASAIFLSLNVYNYFYAGTYLFAFVGVLGFLFCLQRKWEEVRKISTVFFGGLVLSMPYAWNLYEASKYPTYEEVGKRVALMASHAPEFIGIVALFGLLVFLIGFPREDKQKYMFGLALLLTPFVTLNQQIVTGKVLQAGHYHWNMHRPVAIIFVILTLFFFLERKKVQRHYQFLIAVVIICSSIAAGALTQKFAYLVHRDGGYDAQSVVELQRYAPVMEWLNTHAAKESVVFGNEVLSRMVGIFTASNVFHIQVAHSNLSVTDARIREQLYTQFRLRNVTSENVYDVFNAERELFTVQLYGLYFREKKGSTGLIPDEILNDIVDGYKSTLNVPASLWLYETWKKYEVEYLVWDKKSDPTWNLGQFTFLKEEAVFGDFVIYSFVEESQVMYNTP